MRRLLALAAAILATILLAAPGQAWARAHPRLDADSINTAGFSRRPVKGPDPALVRAEILLDRLRFSPGNIDGRGGENVDGAVRAYQDSVGLPPTGKLDQQTFERLTADAAPVITDYEITKKDVKGPFTRKIPKKLEQQAKLHRLGYRNVREMLAERFHMDESLLRALNPRARFRAGESIKVADVSRPKADEKVDRIEVAKGEKRVRAFASDGHLVASYPASIGSEEKPAPSGSFAVRTIARNPDWTYNPKFGFKGIHVDHPLKLPPGPNNPVGAVWIDLTADTYGIHGTPEPSRIGKSFSHGCVRLTNWDALDLAALAHKGTKVDFVD